MTDVRTSIERIPDDHIQLSHQHVLRGNPKELGMQMLRKRDGNKNQCPHENGTQTFEHVNPKPMLCNCGKIHKDHSVENGKIICSSCNSVKDSLKLHPYVKAKERESSAHTQTISQRETFTQSEKHDKERGYWNAWITDFFAGTCPTANKKLGIPEGASIERISFDDLADLAVGEIGLRANDPTGRYGNAQTYKKYIFEDRFINLYLEKIEGVVYVSLRKQEQRENNSGTLMNSPRETALERNEQYLKNHPSERLA